MLAQAQGSFSSSCRTIFVLKSQNSQAHDPTVFFSIWKYLLTKDILSCSVFFTFTASLDIKKTKTKKCTALSCVQVQSNLQIKEIYSPRIFPGFCCRALAHNPPHSRPLLQATSPPPTPLWWPFPKNKPSWIKINFKKSVWTSSSYLSKLFFFVCFIYMATSPWNIHFLSWPFHWKRRGCYKSVNMLVLF